jgi:nucleoside-diphosphate-sugar epimerase
MKILVTGGCGYVGSVLVPNLAAKGHEITVVDAQWFGNFLPEFKNVKVIKKHFSEISIQDLSGIESVIHLANVANDPSVELNPVLSWEVNVLHTNQLLNLCKKTPSLKSFMYASSGSVYGVKEEEQVTEDLDLVPISAYNKTKMSAERVCLSYSQDFDVYCIRPATVCGVSPRMRFDVVVNMFVMHAYRDKKITVLGGDQVRPNIHIQDMSRVYEHFLNNPGLHSGCYNAGFENISVMSIAEAVAEKFGVGVDVKPSNDPRSYRQDSSKLLSTGYRQTKTVVDAIDEIANSLESEQVKDNDRWYTVKWMMANKIGDNE